MATQNPFYTSERADEKMQVEVPLARLIDFQINRMSILHSLKKPEYVDAVEALELMISSYLDDKFEDRVNKVHYEVLMKAKKNKKYGIVSKEAVDSALWTRAKIKQKLLMQLLHRRGFFPAKDIIYDDEEYDKKLLEKIKQRQEKEKKGVIDADT